MCCAVIFIGELIKKLIFIDGTRSGSYILLVACGWDSVIIWNQPYFFFNFKLTGISGWCDFKCVNFDEIIEYKMLKPYVYFSFLIFFAFFENLSIFKLHIIKGFALSGFTFLFPISQVYVFFKYFY